MEIVIEEISRGNKLQHRHQLNKGHIKIGRDYTNDIILADPHICPQHVELSFEQGQWVITDNNTVNGTFLENAKNKTADQHIVQNGDVISLGKSLLRIVFREHQVSPTIPFSSFENLINLLRTPLALTLNLALFIAIAGVEHYLNKSIESNASQLLVSAIGMCLLFALWPAGVALVSHLTKHDARVMTQIGVSFSIFNLMWVSDFLEQVIEFNTASNSVLLILIAVITTTLAFTLFWLNCYIGFHMSVKRRIFSAASLTALLLGGSYLVTFSNKPEFNPHPQYNATIMAPSFLIAPSDSVDEFLEDNNKLFIEAEKSLATDNE